MLITGKAVTGVCAKCHESREAGALGNSRPLSEEGERHSKQRDRKRLICGLIRNSVGLEGEVGGKEKTDMKRNRGSTA